MQYEQELGDAIQHERIKRSGARQQLQCCVHPEQSRTAMAQRAPGHARALPTQDCAFNVLTGAAYKRLYAQAGV